MKETMMLVPPGRHRNDPSKKDIRSCLYKKEGKRRKTGFSSSPTTSSSFFTLLCCCCWCVSIAKSASRRTSSTGVMENSHLDWWMRFGRRERAQVVFWNRLFCQRSRWTICSSSSPHEMWSIKDRTCKEGKKYHHVYTRRRRREKWKKPIGCLSQSQSARPIAHEKKKPNNRTANSADSPPPLF